MTYFADLSDYTYIPAGYASGVRTKNVGWLSSAHAFETGESTEECLDRLWGYCSVSVAQTRGMHQCEFCQGQDVQFAERKGDKLFLGTAEIRVFVGQSGIYAAPTLIYHYVKDHGYKPPEPFIQALMAEPAPPAAEYFDKLAKVSLEWRKTSNAEPSSEPLFPPLKVTRSAFQFASDDKTKLEFTLRPAIRLRDIALLVIGGVAVGGGTGFLAGLPIYGITHSKFAISAVFGICVYASWIVGYNWLSQAQGWDSLRTRFSPVGKKVLILSAIGGVGLVAFIASAAGLLKWAGIQISDFPTPAVLPHDWVELPLAILAIVIIGPLTEELMFRGILLDWLKQKINVWAAAAILSVIFSLLHSNPFWLGAVGWLTFTHRFLLGLTASALAIKYCSLRPSLVMHGTMNAIAAFASVLGAG